MFASLYEKSIQIIKKVSMKWSIYCQPKFPDLSILLAAGWQFHAYAMDRAGEYSSADAFLPWAGRTIQSILTRLRKLNSD
jgi:hypothetical protein